MKLLHRLPKFLQYFKSRCAVVVCMGDYESRRAKRKKRCISRKLRVTTDFQYAQREYGEQKLGMYIQHQCLHLS